MWRLAAIILNKHSRTADMGSSSSLGVQRGAKNYLTKNLKCYETCARPSDEQTGKWRRLHTEELYDLHSSPDVLQVIKSRRMKWTGHVASMGDWRSECKDIGFDVET